MSANVNRQAANAEVNQTLRDFVEILRQDHALNRDSWRRTREQRKRATALVEHLKLEAQCATLLERAKIGRLSPHDAMAYGYMAHGAPADPRYPKAVTASSPTIGG